MEASEKVLNKIVTQLSEIKSAVGIYELPCGWISPEGELVTAVKVRELTGREEDILASSSTPEHLKLNAILTNCVEAVGSITDRQKISQILLDLTSGDRVFLLFMIRLVTLGPLYPFAVTCPECSKENQPDVDLTQLEKKPMVDHLKRVFAVDLPSGKKVTWRVMNGRDDNAAAKSTKKDDLLSQNLLVRVTEIEGVLATMESVKSLGWSDRNFLREQFEEIEGGIDLTTTNTCASCQHEWDVQLDAGQLGFFFPSQARKAWKKKPST